jgi:thymidylate synthase ThyX
MAAHPLDEVRWFGQQMLNELRTMIPSFMKRVDIPDRGGAWSKYFSDVATSMTDIAARLDAQPQKAPQVTLVDYDPDGERKVAAAALYSYTDLPDSQIRDLVAGMSESEIDEIFTAYVGTRSNRRHKPGRGMEQTFYRFDVVCDYGIFRDLQRHRMLTLEWQPLGPSNGYITPGSIFDVEATDIWERAMSTSASLYERISISCSPSVAQYVVPFAQNIRFVMNLNAREAFHIIELRTQQGGHPDYRKVCQDMHTAIREVAGHRRIADAMSYVDHEDYELGRLETERRAAAKRAAMGIADPSA